MDDSNKDRLVEFVSELDELIKRYDDFEAHHITGMLLSRVTVLMAMDPATGKGLLRYVWEMLDEIEQANPGSMM